MHVVKCKKRLAQGKERQREGSGNDNADGIAASHDAPHAAVFCGADVLAGKAVARTDPKHRIYAQIIGTGMLDVACGGLLLEKMAAAGETPLEVDMTK